VEDVFSNRPAEEDFPKFLDVKLAIYRQRVSISAPYAIATTIQNKNG